ncbi:hypothetical protein CRM22_004494 [Opisthorchis felineus]|uniref:Major facilitator superfamily (MFS) profile domain-containing protein n=1 Tax=Opisthorchis felineus TaxID=147828 RepID=A0A4S2LVY6_OPIFE|nr:hypothetical protein CRM22_004494 [Opisthorchis felineus]TGZ68018.1 hypothetical protein CRM22_004494 [Opisthorchis felineus]
MFRSQNEFVSGLLNLAGCMIIQLAYGYYYTIGNMGTYITAYLSHNNKTVTQNDMVVLTSVIISFEALAMPLGGLLHRRFPLRAVIAVSCILHSGSVALTYFSINCNFTAVVVTYGVMQGFGFGLGYALLISIAASWFPNRRSLVVGLVVGAFAAGSFVFTPIQTAYINPWNMQADNVTRTFKDPMLLHRIPSAFLISAAVLAGMEVIGFLLLCEKHVYEITGFSVSESTWSEANEVPSKMNNECAENAVMSNKEMTPLEALQTADFYILWASVCCVLVPQTMLSSLSKFFGLEYIRDDSFLAGITMASSVCNAVGRVIWGLLGDYLSFKVPLCCLLLVWTILLVTFPHLSEFEGSHLKGVYALWVCLMFFCLSGVFVFTPLASNALYGSRNMTINFGLVYSAFIVGGILAAVLTRVPQLHGQTFTQFIIGGMFCCAAFVLCLWLKDPKYPNRLKKLDVFFWFREYISIRCFHWSLGRCFRQCS